MRKTSRYEPLSAMNITTLMDLTFTLLIVFIISTPVMNAQIDLSLPQSTAVEYSDEETIEVSVDKQGKVFIGQTEVGWSELANRLKLIRQQKGISTVALRGAKEIDYGTVMRAIDAVKEAGIVNLGLVALPKTKR